MIFNEPMSVCGEFLLFRIFLTPQNLYFRRKNKFKSKQRIPRSRSICKCQRNMKMVPKILLKCQQLKLFFFKSKCAILH